MQLGLVMTALNVFGRTWNDGTDTRQRSEQIALEEFVHGLARSEIAPFDHK